MKQSALPRILSAGLAATLASTAACAAAEAAGRPKRPNILLITADDMNWNSLGVTGCKTPGMTPNLDRLAAQGMRFHHAHVTISVCQPSRSVLMTGRYPHRNGAMGFQPIDPNVPTLQESLRKAGYLNGIMGKVSHLAPQTKFCWDTVVTPDKLRAGRDPAMFYKYTKQFFQQAKDSGKPFFLMANSHDPHRPFPGSKQLLQQKTRRRNKLQGYPPASKHYTPGEIAVPGFLPDLPDVRKEIAQYFTAVHRCDETVGQILRALDETGQADETLVMFLSDNGMAFPFAKTNVWLNSTRTPWIVRWPGRVRPGVVDDKHFISGIDFVPTALDAAGLPIVEGMDGRSFLPLLDGKEQTGRDHVFTCFFETSGKRKYPMRCVQTKDLAYLFSPWSDGKTVFKNESQAGLTFKAMEVGAKTDQRIAARVKLFQYRVPDELYDLANDPDALHNLIEDANRKPDLEKLRAMLLEMMQRTDDPLLAIFKKHLGKP
ncbi:MAG: sulfatase [Phycisphaerae bacterium]|nr:sulfatase [Phycisphaerae bacterium]